MLKAWLGRVFKIHPEDWKPLLLLQALIAAICTVIAFVKTVSNALFVSHVGVAFLPYTYIVSAISLMTTGFFLVPLIDKYPRLTIYRITTVSLSIFFVFSFCVMLAHQIWVYYLTYILSNIADSILFLEFWLIASDLCDSRQAKRVFPLVIGWSLIGGIMGTFGTKFLVSFMHTEWILLVSSGILLGTLFLIASIQKAFPREIAGTGPAVKVNYTVGRWPRMKLDFRIVEESKLVQFICVSLVLYSILAFMTDFLFNLAVVRHFTRDGNIQGDQLTAFFGFFDGFSITISLVFQFFLTNRILRVIGITNAQLILPSAFGLGFGSVLASTFFQNPSAVFGPALGNRLSQKFLSSSVHRSSFTILYSPVPSEKRGRSKAFAEGIIAPFGVFLAGVLILLVKRLPLGIVAAIATALSVVYILSMLRLRRAYLRQILKMFEDKNFGVLESFAGMFARLGDKEILDKLCDCLEDKDFNVRNFVVELLGEIKNKSAIDPLIELYHGDDNPTVKATAIAVLGRLGTVRIAPTLREAMAAKDARIRANAVEAIEASKNADLYSLIPPCLDDPSPRIHTNAAIALWHLKMQKEIPRAMKVLFDHYNKGTLENKLSALYAFGEIATDECIASLINASRQANSKIVSRAVASLGSTKSEQAVRTLIDLLPLVNSALQNHITNALIKLGPQFPDLILKSLHHPDIYSRKHLIRVAATIPDKRVSEALKELALGEIEAVHRHLEWQEKVHRIPQADVQLLLNDTFEHLNAQAKENVIEVLRTLAGNTPAIQIILKDLSHPNRFIRAAALDALEAVGNKVIAKAFVPILEGKGRGAVPGASPASQEELLAWVRQWVQSPYRWIRACGTFAAGRLGLRTLQQELLSSLSDSYDLVRANTLEALAQFGVSPNRIYFERMLKDSSPLTRRYAQELLS